MIGQKHRLVTRSDMDGLVCAVLLKHLDMIDDIKFVHPKDMQDGIIEITENDITTNLPYVEGVGIAFDHHLSETIRNKEIKANHIILPDAPSAAEVVYQFYGGDMKFPERFRPMMEAANKADAAMFSKQDIVDPQGWDLLSFLMDSRTGLGRFRNFRISNYTLMMNLIDACKDHDIDEIMQLPDVVERVNLYNRYREEFVTQLKKCSTIYDNVVVLDLRDEEIIYPGNRFMIYALYPETNISIHHIWGFQKQNTVFAVGKSIVNKTSQANIGDIMLGYDGGGHMAAGTCQVSHEKANNVLKEIIHSVTDREEAYA
ncbi:MAG: exopolyphosphatase [Epsilonproteobacteria bacterium]|nr:exopolyphosphatase [Campylobacterota bacterium]